MSGSNTTVALTIKLKGDVGKELARIGDVQYKAVQKVNQESQRLKPIQADQLNTAKKIAGELGKQVNLVKASDTARKLGLRTEKEINAEIRKTQANYAELGRLQRKGVMTANDMQRAYAAMNQRVAQLNRELGKTDQIQKAVKVQSPQVTGTGIGTLQKGTMLAGAVAGGVYAIQRPVRDAIQYEKDLAQLSITTYDDKNDRKAGQDRLRGIISSTAKKYGQTTDDVLTGLNSLVASGKYKGSTNAETETNLKGALSAAAEAAQASGGDILDFTQLSVAARAKKLNEREYMSYAVQAGKEGNFETRDLAKYLNKQYGMLPSDPANQKRQASQLMALNQVAMSTAGGADEAGNNVVNLLNKMNADPTKKTLKKDYGIDLEKEYLKGAEQGKTRFDVFGEALAKAMQKDSRYRQVMGDLKKAGNSEERQQILESKQGILQQSALSNVLPDMQALSAGVAMVSQWDEMQRITKANQELGLQSLTDDAGTMRDTASYGVNAGLVTKKNSEFEAMRGLTDVIGDTSLKLSEYADQYPNLSKAIAGTTVAMTALAGVTGGAAIGGVLGGKAGGGAVGGLAAGGAGTAMRVGGQLAVAGVAGYGIGTAARNMYMTTETGQKFDDWAGEKITQVLAAFGNDEAQAALDAQAKYDEMIAQQEQQNQKTDQQLQMNAQFLTELRAMRGDLSNFGNRPIMIHGGSMLDSVSGEAQKQSNRFGTVPYSPLISK
ncbi:MULTISPECIES: hypothetical protein [unclassified Acinetobacter]|uniref:hypothetical protein n=1 Tax=unclassified Acinetobacter TaxID=196816 RepID=UPI00190D6E5B|nr:MULTISPECIES: hypothetical protein [unclassified Acinetobacter]MBK0062381.1 hypothetical protein [Acinetobacter sp. S55]MBK0066185.1 hypothetical protein [Acinetobacter sp. S54]